MLTKSLLATVVAVALTGCTVDAVQPYTFGDGLVVDAKGHVSLEAEALSKALGPVGTRLDAADAKLATHEGRFDALRADLDALTTKSNATGEGVTALGTRLGTAETKVTALTQDVASAGTRLGAAEAAISGLSDDLAELATKSELATLAASVASLEARVNGLRTLPIGTVVGSMRAPADFASDMGSDWALADGRTANAEYVAAFPGVTNLPDLRGQFLRGLNAGRSDGRQDPDAASRVGGNVAGSWQADEVKSHAHTLSTPQQVTRTTQILNYSSGVDFDAMQNSTSAATGGSESRGRNVAVYWYIRIR